MAKVTLYKANDGSLHEKAKDCEKQNTKLRVIAGVAGVEFDMAASSEVDDGRGYAIYIHNIRDFVVANADLLRKVLNDAQIIKRVRKPKLNPTAVAG